MRDKLLIVGPAWVGDMVMAQCLFKLFKQRHPDYSIDVLAPAWSLSLLERMPEVDNAIVMPIGHGELALGKRLTLAKSLREKKYSKAIVLPNSFKSALIPWWANIPVRTGWRGEMRFGLLNDIRTLDKVRFPLMIERFMALGLPKNESLPKEYPLPELQVTEETLNNALTKHNIQLSGRPILALCPGAEFGPAKRWPEEYYAELANEKLNSNWDVWLFGSQKDQSVAEKIMQLTQQRCLNLTGNTKLDEAVDLLSLSSLVVTNDSGLMHIAAALQKPLLAVYGPTSAGFTPPLHAKAKIINLSLECQPCFQRICPLEHHRCMRDLSPEKILNTLREI